MTPLLSPARFQPPGIRFLLVMAARTVLSGSRLRPPGKIHRRSLKISLGHISVFAVARETPPHRQWRKLLNPSHSLNRSMTLLASNARENMLAVIEINKIRKVVYLHPLNRALFLNSLFQFLDLHGLLFQKSVTIHAHAGRRNTRVTAGTRRKMAIEARDFIVARVNLMWKRDRLLWAITLMNSDS